MTGRKKDRKGRGTDRRWHAVSIRLGPHPCDAAISCRGKRWLSREAPALPLPGCTSPSRCRCIYLHHDERRGGSRRAESVEPVGMSSHRLERRQRPTRRGPRQH